MNPERRSDVLRHADEYLDDYNHNIGHDDTEFSLDHTEAVSLVEDLLELIEDYKATLKYIARPTMGLQGDDDAETFALKSGLESNIRGALATCIRMAKIALEE